jgi:hypothetical protein
MCVRRFIDECGRPPPTSLLNAAAGAHHVGGLLVRAYAQAGPVGSRSQIPDLLDELLLTPPGTPAPCRPARSARAAHTRPARRGLRAEGRDVHVGPHNRDRPPGQGLIGTLVQSVPPRVGDFRAASACYVTLRRTQPCPAQWSEEAWAEPGSAPAAGRRACSPSSRWGPTAVEFRSLVVSPSAVTGGTSMKSRYSTSSIRI